MRAAAIRHIDGGRYVRASRALLLSGCGPPTAAARAARCKTVVKPHNNAPYRRKARLLHIHHQHATDLTICSHIRPSLHIRLPLRFDPAAGHHRGLKRGLPRRHGALHPAKPNPRTVHRPNGQGLYKKLEPHFVSSQEKV